MNYINDGLSTVKAMYNQSLNGFEIAKRDDSKMIKIAKLTAIAALGAGVFAAFLGASASVTLCIAGVVGLANFAKMCYDLKEPKFEFKYKPTEFKLDPEKLKIQVPSMKIPKGENPIPETEEKHLQAIEMGRMLQRAAKEKPMVDVLKQYNQGQKEIKDKLLEMDVGPRLVPHRHTEITLDKDGKVVKQDEVMTMKWEWREPKKKESAANPGTPEDQLRRFV